DRPFLLRVVGARPLVADANPVLELRRAGRPVGASLSSWNHSQKGQNVLFGDGSVRWLVVPVVNGDNIFLPVGVDRADRMPNLVELPLAGDGFLAQ
ncbi:MAG: H-X9-DG-CTERM domain-containing protein, partial [Planctomycetota bacterium]